MTKTTVDFSKGEKLVERILLKSITTSDNPRHPAPDLQANLVAEGYSKEVEGEVVGITPIELVHQLVFGEDPEGPAKFVALMDKYEANGEGIVNLAASLVREQLESIKLRSFRAANGKDEATDKTVYVERYGIIDGERRYLASVYNFAKHGKVDTVLAISRKITKDEAFDLAVAANFNRRNPSDVEYGHIFRRYRQRTNPATEKPFTLREIALHLDMDYQFVRSREALTHLSESDQRGVETGRIGVTVASTRGLAIKSGKESTSGPAVKEKKETRQRALNLAQIQVLFDNSRKRSKNYLQALADVMQEDVELAIKNSDTRIKEADAAALAEATKADRANAA